MMNPDYSVVVPVYGAEDSLKQLHESIRLFFENRGNTYEVIYVDDGSLDSSWEVLKAIRAQHHNVTAIRLSKNFGQHAATICGFKYAKGYFAITIDDDLEVHPREIEKLIANQAKDNADLTYGIYPKINQGAFKNGFTRLYKLLSKIEGPQKGKGSSFRLLKMDLAKKLANNHRQFVFIDELCLWYTSKVNFLDVTPNPNYILKQRYKIGGLLRLTSTVIMFSSNFPLKLVTYLGLSLSALNFIIGTIYLIRKIFFKIQVAGYTSLIVSILFSTGLIILCLGIIAQYIRQALKSINHVPCYNEDEALC